MTQLEPGSIFDVWLDWIGSDGPVMANYDVVVGQHTPGDSDPVSCEVTRLNKCRLSEGALLFETESLPPATQDELKRMIGREIKIAPSGMYSGVPIYAERP